MATLSNRTMTRWSAVALACAALLAACGGGDDSPATTGPLALKTLDGSAPVVVAHRGASGYLPEHTLEAYTLAIDLGADVVEPDLIATKDGVLIARHDPNLDYSTNVASRPEFAARKKTTQVDGETQTGWFASDFTLAEIKTLGAITTDAERATVYNGAFKVVTFQEIIDLVKAKSAAKGRTIAIYPETKNPTYHRALGLPLEDTLIAQLVAAGWNSKTAPVYVQSFEPSSLKTLRSKGLNTRLIQLIDADDVDLKTGALTFAAPYDRPYDWFKAGDTRLFSAMVTPAGLAEIKTYADEHRSVEALHRAGQGHAGRERRRQGPERRWQGQLGRRHHADPDDADCRCAQGGPLRPRLHLPQRAAPPGLRLPGRSEGRVPAVLPAGPGRPVLRLRRHGHRRPPRLPDRNGTLNMSQRTPLFALTAVALLAMTACGTDEPLGTSAASTTPFTVKIVGFNDYHGTLQSPGTFGTNTAVPTASRPAVGGADYLAGHVNKLKAQNPLNVVVGAGDFIGASPLISSLFNDEPAIETLNRIGVEFNAVGNHEFDHGSAELLRLQNGGCKVVAGAADPNSCKGLAAGTPVPFEGAKFKWLSANVVDTATGKPLLPAYGIKTFNGVKMAFIGMTLQATPTIVTPSGVAGLSFKDEAATVNALIPELRAQGVESIVVLVHQGGFQSATSLSDINGCDGDLAGSDIATVVKQLDNAVDLVISGHTHAAYNCSAGTVDVTSTAGVVSTKARTTGLANATGRRVPVTSASSFGRVLSDIDVTIDPTTRDITAVQATNRLVDRTDTTVTPDSAIQAIVKAYNDLISPLANKVIGAVKAELPATAADAACNMPAGRS